MLWLYVLHIALPCLVNYGMPGSDTGGCFSHRAVHGWVRHACLIEDHLSLDRVFVSSLTLGGGFPSEPLMHQELKANRTETPGAPRRLVKFRFYQGMGDVWADVAYLARLEVDGVVSWPSLDRHISAALRLAAAGQSALVLSGRIRGILRQLIRSWVTAWLPSARHQSPAWCGASWMREWRWRSNLE